MSTDELAMAIHATAVALESGALVIRGPSRSGKSTLALALIAASRPERPICLVGDDRVLLRCRGSTVLVAPHPRITGLIERRGCGILSLPHCSDVPLAGIVDLAPAPGCALLGRSFPLFSLADAGKWTERAARVLHWVATLPAQSGAKTSGGSLP